MPKITEIIPDDMPEWVIEAMENGQFFNVTCEKIKELQYALEEAKSFAAWVECLGRTDCEIYKHELKGSADRSIERIEKALSE